MRPAAASIARARPSIEEADEAEIAARGEGAGLAGRLRVSAAVTFARLNIVPAFLSFLAAHPDLEIDLVLDDRDIHLVGEGIDVSLRMGNLADSTLTARKIGEAARHHRRDARLPERIGMGDVTTCRRIQTYCQLSRRSKRGLS